MSKNKQIEYLKERYDQIEIPEELDERVQSAMKQANQKNNKQFKVWGSAVAAAAAATVLLTVGINASPAFAETLSKIPVVKSIVSVLTFKEIVVDDGGFQANIEIPKIDGLDNKELEGSLNEKYLQENKELYQQFMTDIEEMKQAGIEGHMGVDSGYVVKTDTDQILSIGRYVVNIVGSSSTVFQYDTIDKVQEVLITLPSLFKDDSYIDVISANIKEQMQQQMNDDENVVYWLDSPEGESLGALFEQIDAEQSFYITADGKLVISFDKYEVAPGYMGVVEFEIPNEVIQDILVGDEYIK